MKIIAGTQRKYRHALFHFSSDGNLSRSPLADADDLGDVEDKCRRKKRPLRENAAGRLIPSFPKVFGDIFI